MSTTKGKVAMRSRQREKNKRAVEPTRKEILARQGISIEDDIDSEAWQVDYVMTEVESALQARVDELYLLVDYHRRALLERDTRIASLEHDLDVARERHLAAIDAERQKTRDSTEGLSKSLHRNQLELKRLRVQGRWNVDLRAEVEALKARIKEMEESHAEALDAKEKAIVSTRLELRREFTRRREEERREITDQVRRDLEAEGVRSEAEVRRLRFQVETTESRIKDGWERSNAVEAQANADRLRRETAEAERDARMREAVVFKRRCKEAERALRDQRRHAAEREALLRNRVRVLKATVRAMTQALGEGEAQTLRAETPMLEDIMREGSDEDIFLSDVTRDPRAEERRRKKKQAAIAPVGRSLNEKSASGDVADGNAGAGMEGDIAIATDNSDNSNNDDNNGNNPKVTVIDRSQLGPAGPSMWRISAAGKGKGKGNEDTDGTPAGVSSVPLSTRAARREARLAAEEEQKLQQHSSASASASASANHETQPGSGFAPAREDPAWPEALREERNRPQSSSSAGVKIGGGRPLPKHDGRFINP